MNKNKKGLILTVVALLGLIVITTGVTFAFFNYAKQGTTDNSVTTGTITFLYTEVSGVGRGISIKDAYPVSDEVGKAQIGEGKVFDFKATSTTPSNASIPYEITARKKADSTLDESAVKLYLTKVSGDIEEEVLLDNYTNLTQTSKVSVNEYTEKILHTDKVPADITNYEQAYRLRMWIDDSIDFSPVKDENGNDIYPYNNKEFTVTVNVYANAKVVTQDEIDLENAATIENIETEDGTGFTEVENQEYDYEATLPEGTTETTINVETNSPNATVEVEKLDSLAFSSSSIKRLSTSKVLQLTDGDNYFKVTVISENKKVENEFILKIYVGKGFGEFAQKILDANPTIYENPTLTNSSNDTNDPSGLYKSTATNSGEPTYYFRGNVNNNWVDFAGFTWRVVRINEDGTIRLVMQDVINTNTNYKYNTSYNNKNYMYYSNSNTAKPTLETWYTNNIVNKGYSSYVVTGDYYCEQAKVAYSSSFATDSGANMVVYTDYTNPNFKCETDSNGKGIVNGSIGLLSYDEVLHAGGYNGKSNSSYYLYNKDIYWWTMSPAGFSGSDAFVWIVNYSGNVGNGYVNFSSRLRAVLNLKADTAVTGNGTSDSHWAVQ